MKLWPVSRRYKLLLITLGLTIGASLASLAIRGLGHRNVGEILFELVRRETNSYYQLSYEKLNVNIWEGSISLHNLLLHPDSTKNFDSLGLENLYQLEIAALKIDLQSVLSIYIDKELVINTVRITDPDISMVKNNPGRQSFSFQAGNLYKAISDYLKVLRIDYFRIDNGSLEHMPSQFSLGSFDFFVENLLLDSMSRSNRVFYSENIELEISNQIFYLPDSVHQVTFDRFLLSTEDSVLSFENLIISPTRDQEVDFEELRHFNVYDIKIPELELKGVDYAAAYRDNHLKINELAILDAQIFIDDETHFDHQQTIDKDNSLLKQFFNVFFALDIGKLRVINTHLDLRSTGDDQYQELKAERTDVAFYHIHLDTGNYRFDHRYEYFDNVDVIVKDYVYLFPDSVHTLQFDLLQVNSFDSTLRLDQFAIFNNGRGHDSATLLDIRVPILILTGLDYIDALVHDQLALREAFIREPYVDIKQNTRPNGRGTLTTDTFRSLIRNYFRAIHINDFRLDDGRLTLNSVLKFDQLNAGIRDFSINADTRSLRDLVREIELSGRGFSYSNDSVELSGDRFEIGGQLDQLNLGKWDISYSGDEMNLLGRLDGLSLSGIQPDSLFAGNYTAFDTLHLIKPDITLQFTTTGNNDQFGQGFNHQYFVVEDGRIDLTWTDSTIFKADSINTNLLLKESYSHIFRSDISVITAKLPGLGHHITVQRLVTQDDTGQIRLEDVGITSQDNPLSLPFQLDGKLPLINLYGLDQTAFWTSRQLKADSLLIDLPTFTLMLNDNLRSPADSQQLSVVLGKVILNKARAGYAGDQTVVRSLEAPELSLILEDFDFPGRSVFSDSSLLFAEDLKLSLKSLRPVLQNGDSMEVGSLIFTGKSGQLTIDSLSYEGKEKSLCAFLNRVHVSGLNLKSLAQEDRIDIDSLSLKGRFSLEMSTGNSDGPQDLRFKPITIGHLSARSTIEIRDSAAGVNYKVPESSLRINNFSSPDVLVWKDFFDYPGELSFGGTGLELPLLQEYVLNIGEYDFRHPDNFLELSRISLTSPYSPEEYSTQLSYQNDWYQINIDHTELIDINLSKWISREQYRIQKIVIDGLDALIYRDKSLPFPPDQVRDLPQSYLRDLDHWLYLDTLQFTGDVTYQEMPVNYDQHGEITFNDLNAYLLHTTSVDSAWARPMKLQATGKLMNSGDFEAVVLFNLNDPNHRFIFTGEINRLPLDSLNRMLEPVASVNIKDGFGQRIWFRFSGNDELARGEMKFRYDNLKVVILNPETHDRHGLGQGIKTFFANTFVVKHRNPGFLFFLRDGTIFQERDPSRAIFHYWGKALLSGAVSSVGIHRSEKAAKKYRREHRGEE